MKSRQIQRDRLGKPRDREDGQHHIDKNTVILVHKRTVMKRSTAVLPGDKPQRLRLTSEPQTHEANTDQTEGRSREFNNSVKTLVTCFQ